MIHRRAIATLGCVLPAVLALASGCSKPNAANIELRKQNQDLRTTIERLEREHEADQARIRSAEAKIGTLPTFPEDRLQKMFTAHGLQFGRLTGGADLDPNKPGDEGLKVYLAPIDDDGETIKSVGSLLIEAFDLDGQGQKIGEWSFSADDMRKSWYGSALMHTFVLTLPWQQVVPRHPELTLKIKFTDDLTQRTFEAQRVVQLKPPELTASTAPAVTQATRQP